MNRLFSIIIPLFIAMTLGCNSKTNQNAAMPVENDKANVLAPQEKEQKYVGCLSKVVMQHPIIDPRQEQDYFDVYEHGKFEGNQIIVIYDKGLKQPNDPNKFIEIVGRAHSFSLGGEPGTKLSYGGTVMYVRTWRYLNHQAN